MLHAKNVSDYLGELDLSDTARAMGGIQFLTKKFY